jgi:hypothetical protein
MPFGNSRGQGFNDSGIVVASKVVIIGAQGELLVYSPSAGANTLILSISGVVGGSLDAYGNHVNFGLNIYDNAGGFFTQYGAGFVTFGTGTGTGGWTANSSFQNDALGNLYLDTAGGGSVFVNGTALTVP